MSSIRPGPRRCSRRCRSRNRISGAKTEREVKYGPADRHLLDVFTPETAASARPVLIFIHGGAFVAGNKRTTPTSPFYDNVMLWAVHNGFVGVNATYRLAPQSPYPAGAEDLAAVVAWIASKIGERGGDPARIYLMGIRRARFMSPTTCRIRNFTR